MDVLTGKTVGIIGLGRIGREVARVVRFFNMKVVATKRTATQATLRRTSTCCCHWRVCTTCCSRATSSFWRCQLTPESRNLIGEPELRAMKPTAKLINVSRGAIVDEPALIRALQEGWIGGAGLDVFVQEPLPADSPLRRMQNVIFSPHVSGDIAEYDVGAARLFAENLRRFLAGEPLLNIVDKERGY
jgi:phosphoglycerate dehydrogenase-like enzyme